MTENYRSMMKEQGQQEVDQMHQCQVLIEQLQRKNEQAESGRTRVLAVRKAYMLGRTVNQSLAEQRKKVSHSPCCQHFCCMIFFFAIQLLHWI